MVHQHQNGHEPSPMSSGFNTPPSHPAPSSYLPNVVTGFLRRFSSDLPHIDHSNNPIHATTFPTSSSTTSSMDGVYTPPYRSASPYQPPPLTPLTLKGYEASTAPSAQLLSRTIAEEIRLLVPARLQLVEDWNLVYSLEQDGVSLGTLYKKCEDLRGLRNGFVLVVRDGEGGLFGAYLTEAPHPSPHYFGTGECFLWRASILSTNLSLLNLSSLPPPPSADTTHMQRTTTLRAPLSSTGTSNASSLTPFSSQTGATTPDHIRFKAFPYSGVNDYLIFCETGFLSIGGGDGHYGLWLDDQLENGISSSCLTFGNEALSDEGTKFEVLGVEIWSVGNTL